MKPKTTQNLFKNFLAINLKNKILSFFGIALKKISLSFSSLIYVFIMLLLLSTSIAFSQSSSCQAKLTVDHALNLLIFPNTDGSCTTTSNVNVENPFTDINLNPKY